ncbi:hypothetical protein F4780DRAFT_101640 [Xylariomycetidae sp. FL0641]|nr:hypothetical protein F4780DRAFT_101640 [Xylariomycetidae sp. FL0641]
MDSARSAVDLEKELTCSICTEVLYQPLTLLDCLHTFCGACLKDWFSWQRTLAENSPNQRSSSPAAPTVYTCPSCRARVRDTKHNATVTTLLEMFLVANPDKAKPEDEMGEMRGKYRPGDNVLPQVRLPDKSPEDRRLEQMERQMLEQAREMSLRDVGVDSDSSQSRRRRTHSRSVDERGTGSRSDRDGSRDPRFRDAHDRTRRHGERRRLTESSAMLRPDSSSDERRCHHGEPLPRSRESSRTRRRHIEHQASIRSLISSSDVDSRDLEQEIDDFARQIQEEGLLDGLDLDNIDLNHNDELSRKITEAYRRRQRDRVRSDARRSDVSLHSHRSEATSSSSHPRHPLTEQLRTSGRQRSSSAHIRPSTSAGYPESRSRPPATSTHLDLRGDSERRRRRRNSSNGRSATDPIRPSAAETRPAARSQTDLTLRSQSSEPSNPRPSIADGRSTSMPIEGSGGSSLGEHARVRDLSFSGRAAAAQNSPAPPPLNLQTDNVDRPRRSPRPSGTVAPQSPLPSLGLLTSPVQRPHHQRKLSQFYQEPSITCSSCQRPHIEYELHFNCARCLGGNWNICLACYRGGKGCRHWFGFGYAAFEKWERAQAAAGSPLEPPHMLTSNRFRPPRHMPGGADGRKTLTTDDPSSRLESGMFCSRCFAHANACFWRCDSCNDGDWGFCHACVNQGFACSHPLLPLTHVPSSPDHSPPGSPGSRRPRAAILAAAAHSIGNNFRPLAFHTTCDLCRASIAPRDRRFHCHVCTSALVADAHPGDYDVCVSCYDAWGLSPTNREGGWRRCARGHRMTIITFRGNEAKLGGALRRVVFEDLVGGRDLQIQPYDNSSELWSWYEGSGDTRIRYAKVVDRDPKIDPPAMDELPAPPQLPEDPDADPETPPKPPTCWADDDTFPPPGGAGRHGVAAWAWIPSPEATDELLFPKGAEVQEIEDVNGDWSFGAYMGVCGIFPTPYVRIHGG